MKLRLDLAHGQFEADGDDATVKELYLHFMGNHSFKPQTTSQADVESEANVSSEERNSLPNDKPREKKKKSPKKSSSPKIYKMVSAVTEHSDSKDLKKFHDGFTIASNEQRVTLFVYYLTKTMNISGVTEDHIYTCYNLVSVKKPTVLNQQVRNAKQKGWLNHDDWQDIKVTSPGENLIEHILTKL